MVIARITSKGRITVPKLVRERLGIESGDGLEFVIEGDCLEVRPIYRRKLAEFRGLFPVAQSLMFADERVQARISRGRLISVDMSTDA